MYITKCSSLRDFSSNMNIGTNLLLILKRKRKWQPVISRYCLISLQKQANHQQYLFYVFTVVLCSSWEVILELKMHLKIIDILEFRNCMCSEQWPYAKWNYYYLAFWCQTWCQSDKLWILSPFSSYQKCCLKYSYLKAQTLFLLLRQKLILT